MTTITDLMRFCSIDGCGNRHFGKGFCRKHYSRMRRHGDPLGGRTPEGDVVKFYEDVVLSYDGKDCLIWPFCKTNGGYGLMWKDGKNAVVSRAICEAVHGAPPTPKHEAAHSCGNGHIGCVSPNHLSWKTPTENQADMLTHGTQSRGERNGQSRLTERQVREILTLKGRETQASIAKHYAVCPQTISQIHRGEIWAWIHEGTAQ